VISLIVFSFLLNFSHITLTLTGHVVVLNEFLQMWAGHYITFVWLHFVNDDLVLTQPNANT